MCIASTSRRSSKAFPGSTSTCFQAIVSVILILAFWLIMARKNAMVPSKGQYIGETAYFFVRNTIARDMIGHDFRRYLPLLIALFSFVLVNNLFGRLPAHSAAHPVPRRLAVRPGPPGLGDLQRGRHRQVSVSSAISRTPRCPSGVPAFMWPLIIPLEFVSNIIVRPITLSLRLFANMFAGHLLVLVFVLGGEYLLLHSETIINKTAGVVALIFSMAIFGLEIFVQSLQAFIFTVLTAQYISSAAAEEH